MIRPGRALESLICILIFTNTAVRAQQVTASAAPVIEVNSKASLLHLGSLDSFDVTRGGTQAAEHLLKLIEQSDRAAGEQALAIWTAIIPNENFGGEYTSLKWLVECLLATPDVRERQFLAQPETRSFYQLLAKNNFADLRVFIRHKYHLDDDKELDADTEQRNRFLEDFLLFANPRRESWEKSSKMVEALKITPGLQIADIGSGPGYFTLQFAKLVGPGGMVHAVDTNRDHADYLDAYLKEQGIKNVRTVLATPSSANLPRDLDLIYVCSVYHNLYGGQSDTALNGFIEEIKRALKPDGRLVIVDNGPVASGLPYHGPYIAREFIIHQLHYFGFDLAETHQFIPQRYMLTFKKNADHKPKSMLDNILTIKIPPLGLVTTSLKEMPPSHGVCEFVDGDPSRIRVLSSRTLIPCSGALLSFSLKGREVAGLLLDALKTKDVGKLLAARVAYSAMIPAERLGDEHSALRWFCEYALASPEVRQLMSASPLTANYVSFFCDNDYERLKTYLECKYLLGEELDKKWTEFLDENKPPVDAAAPIVVPAGFNQLDRKRFVKPSPTDSAKGDQAPPPFGGAGPAASAAGTKPAVQAQPGTIAPQTPSLAASAHQMSEANSAPPEAWITVPYQSFPITIPSDTLKAWDEYVVFSNPERENWEKTGQMMDFLEIKPGDHVADVGSGAGYYTLKMAERVGAQGVVYALEMAEEQHKDLLRVAEKSGLANIKPVLSKENDATLPENSLDMAYLCSIYHATYVTSMEHVKDQFVASLRKALKPGGRLVIVDNDPMPHELGGYYGPRIAKELIIAQLLRQGFRFASFAQFIPQRYVLVFEVDK